jgi:hypothetical protein
VPSRIVRSTSTLARVDGHQVLEQIRADLDLKVQPVAILSSSREIHDVTRVTKRERTPAS